MNTNTDEQIPIVVDLDGTLLKTELPWESFVSVLSHHPFLLIKIFFNRIIHFKKHFIKIKLEQTARPFLKEVPLSKKFLHYLKIEKSKGRELVLCTGSTQSYADKIKQLVPIFSSVWGSTPQLNLVGKNKAQFLVQKYGEKKFDYAGNSFVDLHVASSARRFILVNPSLWLQFRTKHIPIHKTFKERRLTIKEAATSMGVFLWLINGFIYTILFLIKPLYSTLSYFITSLISLNCLASAFYMLFLMTRIFSDRKANANNNSFATGHFSLQNGFLFSTVFFITFLIVSLILISKDMEDTQLLMGIPFGYIIIPAKLFLPVLYVFGIYRWVCRKKHSYWSSVFLTGSIFLITPILYILHKL